MISLAQEIFCGFVVVVVVVVVAPSIADYIKCDSS